MCWNGLKTQSLVVLIIAVALGLGAAPATADKPSWAGGGKEKHSKSSKEYKHEGKREKAEKKHGKSKRRKHGKHFGDHDHHAVRDYYSREFRKRKRCPPGLAKKNNGCMPPGQAKKKWAYGKSLPRDVVYHDLPRQLVLELPVPPEGQRYVRVLSDVLLIAKGTGIVIDAIQDLGSLQ